MDRRTFLKTSGAVAGTAAVAGSATAAAPPLPAPALATGMRELTMVTSWAPDQVGHARSAENFASRLETALDGRYTIKVYGAGERSDPLRCFDALGNGTADLYHSVEYHHQARSKAFAFFAAVPFGLNADEMNAWVLYGGGQKLWDDLAGQFGIKPFLCGNTGSQSTTWFKAPPASLADLEALAIHMPGLGGDLVRALGAAPVTLAGANVGPALAAGTIAAAEGTGPYGDLASALHQAAGHMYSPGIHGPGTVLSLGVRRALWDRMSRSDQIILAAIAMSQNSLTLAEANANNAMALDTLVRRHGVRVATFPAGIAKGLREAGADILATAANADMQTRKVYESYTGFRKIALERSQVPGAAFVA